MITLERNYAITHAMHLNKRLSLKHAAYIMIGAWSFSILLASLPLVGQYAQVDWNFLKLIFNYLVCTHISMSGSSMVREICCFAERL